MIKSFMRVIPKMSIVLCALLALSGCKIDGEEELEIYSDGALSMRLNYQIPELGLSLVDGQKLVSFINDFSDRHESISITELSCERAGNSTVRIIAEIHSSDALKLKQIANDELQLISTTGTEDAELLRQFQSLIGIISLQLKGKEILFQRTITLDGLLDSDQLTLNPKLLGNYQFRYSLTSPSPATSHNATITSNNGKTLTWVMPLRDYASIPFVMDATIPIPLPWWVWAIVLLVGVFVLWLIWRIIKALKKR